MLKRNIDRDLTLDMLAAAFGRLCVETYTLTRIDLACDAAAFGRLCVETARLGDAYQLSLGSRLRAAVC